MNPVYRNVWAKVSIATVGLLMGALVLPSLAQGFDANAGEPIPAGIGKKIEKLLAVLDLEVAVDVGVCGTGAVQCALPGSGHTTVGAASTNHNPIRIGVLVTLHGAGVAGLGDANLVFNDAFVPAGGPGAVEYNPAACGANCFQTDGAGLYVFFAHPGATGVNWKAGHYIGTVTVTTPKGVTGESIVDWEIA